MRHVALAGVLVLALCAGASAQAPETAPIPQEVPVEQIQAEIARGVEMILGTQQPDGSFRLSEEHMKDYPVGNSALAVMALQYARPHLTGDLRTRAFDGIRAGLSWMTQQEINLKVYSAGLAICAFYNESPERYRRWIDGYAMSLALSQHEEPAHFGGWSYNLYKPPVGQQTKPTGQMDGEGADRSNTQFALLGLYYADRTGFQVPKVVWRRAQKFYYDTQFPDGGWGYRANMRPDPYASMSIASTISLNLCNEMLLEEPRGGSQVKCAPPPADPHVENGLKWIAANWVAKDVGSDTYGLYALERLGIIMGRANIGGHDWFNEGARRLLKNRAWTSMAGTPPVSNCFGVMFLARGLEPIVINKLERKGTADWNNTPYDVKHLIDYIHDHHQAAIQWRIVSLDAPMHLIQRTPILHISGHDPLSFTPEEKQKLKDYVMNGGTILAQACCGRKPFDTSIHELTKEIFGNELKPITLQHPIYQRMRTRGFAPTPKIEVLTLESQGGRPGIIYLPYGVARNWHLGVKAESDYAIGTGIYYYVTVECRKMFENSRPPAPAPAPAPAPTPDAPAAPAPTPAAPAAPAEAPVAPPAAPAPEPPVAPAEAK